MQDANSPNSRPGVPRYQAWNGIALFRNGFRPFFLASGLSAFVFMVAWIAMLEGALSLDRVYDPIQWHAHEMIFGTLTAAVAGFLLTAIPNWTGRLPLQGWPLIGLTVLWLAGRIAMVVGTAASPLIVALVDNAFLFALLAVVVREIVAGRNWRNLPVVTALGLLAAANIISHLEALGEIGTYGFGARMGISVIAALIALIGGRIIPSFTGNWLAKQDGVHRRPSAFGKFDVVTIIVTVISLGAWTGFPEQSVTGGALFVAGVANMVRIARWQGYHTVREPLVWSLHLGYLWLPVGLILLGLSHVSEDVPANAGIHALTAGAMGGMILAVMTRATLGHTGRALMADKATFFIYGFGFLAALTRVAASLAPELYAPLLIVAGGSWCAAFGLFSIRYGAILLSR